MSSNVNPIEIKLFYNNYNVTSDFSPYIESIVYKDFFQNQCDELSIVINDTNQLFQKSWYPEKGAKLYCTIQQGSELLNCGTFKIDEITLDISNYGNRLEINALAVTNALPLRTVKSDYYEKTTLNSIAQQIATKYGLKLLSFPSLSEEIVIERINQTNETDLAFLKRIAKEYGYIFKITDNLLTFIKLYNPKPVLTLSKNDIKSITIKDSSVKKYKGCQIDYYNPTKKVLETVRTGDTNGDILKLKQKFNSREEALEIIEAQLDKVSKEISGRISLKNPLSTFLSGVDFTLTDMGVFNGNYRILSATHVVNSNGWQVSADFEK